MIIRTVAAGALFLLFSACATVRGAQDPDPQLLPQSPLNASAALLCYHGSDDDQCRNGMDQQSYRNYAVSLYLQSSNERYQRFVNQLNSGTRGGGLFADLLMLSLNGAAALSGASSVDEIATVTAVTTGARASVDRRLYFDQALPSVIAAMDADRATVLADISRGRALPVSRYSFDDALDDLRRLNAAGNIVTAFSRINRVVAQDRDEAQAMLSAITAACDDITPASVQLNQRLRQLLHTRDAKEAGRLAIAAEVVGLEADGAALTWNAVANAIDSQFCDDVDRGAIIDRIQQSINQAGA